MGGDLRIATPVRLLKRGVLARRANRSGEMTKHPHWQPHLRAPLGLGHRLYHRLHRVLREARPVGPSGAPSAHGPQTAPELFVLHLHADLVQHPEAVPMDLLDLRAIYEPSKLQSVFLPLTLRSVGA